jgi:hypothetical protein
MKVTPRAARGAQEWARELMGAGRDHPPPARRHRRIVKLQKRTRGLPQSRLRHDHDARGVKALRQGVEHVDRLEAATATASRARLRLVENHRQPDERFPGNVRNGKQGSNGCMHLV